jgi:Flp pilus assembly protein TadB
MNGVSGLNRIFLDLPGVLGAVPFPVVFWPVVFGMGAYLIVTSQPIGRPKPDLLERLGRLDVDERLRRQATPIARRPLFAVSLLEALLRPIVDDAGRRLQAALGHLGVRGGKDLERRLRIARPDVDPTQFAGEKVVAGIVGAAVFPLMNLLGVQPFGPWPVWYALVGGIAGSLLPEWQLERQLAARRTLALMELPSVLDLLTICASAGLALEQALREVASRSNGLVAQELQAAAREMALGRTLAEALEALAERNAVPELTRVVTHLQAAHEHGMPLVQTLSVQAESLRERQRLRILEAGGKATVQMIIPVALFIFPVLFVILLVPAGVQLLQLGG